MSFSANPNAFLPEDIQSNPPVIHHLGYIGQGGSSTLHKVRSGSDVYALKVFIVRKNESTVEYHRRILHEYILHFCAKHLHISSVFNLIQISPATLELPIHSWGMLMKLYPATLQSLLELPEWKLTSIQEKWCLWKQICLAVAFLHARDVCHLDIKPENVLISSNGVATLSDFGCAVIGHSRPGDFTSGDIRCNERLGTPPYRPPESYADYSPFKVDWWSLGMLLFVISTNKAPFKEAIESDSNYQKYKYAYQMMLLTHPSFLKGEGIPQGHFAPNEWHDERWIWAWWRLCDPNDDRRLSLKKLFTISWFQQLGLCIDEMQYECNFIAYGETDKEWPIPCYDNRERVHRLNFPIFTTGESQSHWYRSLISGSKMPEHNNDVLVKENDNCASPPTSTITTSPTKKFYYPDGTTAKPLPLNIDSCFVVDKHDICRSLQNVTTHEHRMPKPHTI